MRKVVGLEKLVLQGLISKHDTGQTPHPQTVESTAAIDKTAIDKAISGRLAEIRAADEKKARLGWAVIGAILGAWLMLRPFGLFMVMTGHYPALLIIAGAAAGFFLKELLAIVGIALLAYMLAMLA
jgi:hypothetical protein